MADSVAPARRPTVEAPPSNELSIHLTGEFQLLVDGQRLPIPHSVERLLAFLALANRPISRGKIAGTLWADVAEERAAGNLRSAVWRLNRLGHRVVVAEDDRLALVPEVGVDAIELADLMRRLVGSADDEALDRVQALLEGTDLLPDWEDEWVVVDRERFRLMRLEALERAAETLIDRDELGRALEAALGAIQAEPFRESARRLQVRIHLAEGNLAEALHAYGTYRDLVIAELGLEPSPAMFALVRPLLEGPATASG